MLAQLISANQHSGCCSDVHCLVCLCVIVYSAWTLSAVSTFPLRERDATVAEVSINIPTNRSAHRIAFDVSRDCAARICSSSSSATWRWYIEHTNTAASVGYHKLQTARLHAKCVIRSNYMWNVMIHQCYKCLGYFDFCCVHTIDKTFLFVHSITITTACRYHRMYIEILYHY